METELLLAYVFSLASPVFLIIWMKMPLGRVCTPYVPIVTVPHCFTLVSFVCSWCDWPLKAFWVYDVISEVYDPTQHLHWLHPKACLQALDTGFPLYLRNSDWETYSLWQWPWQCTQIPVCLSREYMFTIKQSLVLNSANSPVYHPFASNGQTWNKVERYQNRGWLVNSE